MRSDSIFILQVNWSCRKVRFQNPETFADVFGTQSGIAAVNELLVNILV